MICQHLCPHPHPESLLRPKAILLSKGKLTTSSGEKKLAFLFPLPPSSIK